MNKPVVALLILVPFAASAGPYSYDCETKQVVHVQPDGTVKVVPASETFEMFRRFSIDRRTAEKVGGPVGHLQEEPPRIFATGGSESSFVAFWVGPAAGGGVHLDVLRVEEYAPGSEKPFIAFAGGTVYAGLCE